MCVDYRKLNKVIKLSQYPMPNINVMLQSLVGKKFFTTCDLHSGYWQIPLTPQAKELTAFSTMGGHWEFNVLPFGLPNAPGGFERAMETVFEEDLGKTVFIYLDDILIATETLEEHLQVLEKVLTKLREYNLRLKPKKRAFLKTETAFLGHVISDEGLKTDAEKIEKVNAYPVPKNTTEVRSFLGLCNYYRQFVRNFTLLSKPLRDILTKGNWQWTEKEQSAFEELKKRMSSTPVLAQPDIEAAISGERPFILYTDASKDGVGAVLHQVSSDGKEHPIAYASKSCSQAERNYAITDLEALALIFALDKFKYFLLGTYVIARTDHQPLVSLFKRSDLSGRAHRWALEIQEWNNLKIEYIPGTKNVVADALSRNVEQESADNTLSTQIKAVVMSIQSEPEWLNELKSEDWLKGFFELPPEACEKAFLEQNLSLENGQLHKQLPDSRKVLVVPQSRARAIFEQFHSGTLGGHAGWYKTVKMMEKYVFWSRMRHHVKKWIRKCFTCAHTNKQRKAVPPLKPIVSKRPYELVGIDVFSLGQTSSGYQHVVTVIDHHSKFCSAYPVTGKSAPEVAKVFWENWCLREGRQPIFLLSDRGGEFLNEIMDEVRKLSGMDQKFTIGHNPRENGCTERMNETLKGLLMKMSDGASEWDQRLPYALFFYNTSPHKTTGESPFFLLHGADANFPVCGVPSTTVSPYTVDLDGYNVELARGMKALHELITEHITSQAESMKSYYDRVNQVGKTQFKLFDRVFVFNPNVGVDKDSTKLTSPWEGPFRIVEMSDNSATVRYLGPMKLEKRVQMDFLRKVHPEVVEDQFYLYKPDKKRGRPKSQKNATESVTKKTRLEVGGTLMDVNNGCGYHMDYKLSLMPVKQPISASLWTAKSAFELAHGAAVAEAVNMTSGDKDNFFMGTSPAVSELGLAEPKEDQLVQAVLKMCERCPRLKLAFMENANSELMCTTMLSTAKAARKVRVVERVRAILDGNKELRTEETIVIGGRNANRFAESLGLSVVAATTASEVRSYLLESHFASTVKRIFIWPEEFKNIVLDQFVDGFKQAVSEAARWEHIVFIVMPMVFASAHRPLFDRFTEEFKKDPPKLKNVLWIDDTVDWSGFRFSRSLGANELSIDATAVTQDGFITRKGAAAAVQFLKNLCSWLFIEPAPGPSRDLFEYQSPLQNPTVGNIRFNSARGVPSRGGGGAGRFAQAHRGRGYQPYNTGRARGRRGSKLNML